MDYICDVVEAAKIEKNLEETAKEKKKKGDKNVKKIRERPGNE